MLAMSTPYGRRGWFWEASKSNEWRVTTVTADQCPRISAEFLAAERVALGEWRYRQEYACEFTDLAGRMFASADLDAAFAIGQLGGVPQGALFGGSANPAVLRIVDAPRSVGPCPYSDDGHHFWNEGFCTTCHVRQDPAAAPPCTHSHRRNGQCVECHAIVRLPAIGA
jgi:hypothetical protein